MLKIYGSNTEDVKSNWCPLDVCNNCGCRGHCNGYCASDCNNCKVHCEKVTCSKLNCPSLT